MKSVESLFCSDCDAGYTSETAIMQHTKHATAARLQATFAASSAHLQSIKEIVCAALHGRRDRMAGVRARGTCAGRSGARPRQTWPRSSSSSSSSVYIKAMARFLFLQLWNCPFKRHNRCACSQPQLWRREADLICLNALRVRARRQAHLQAGKEFAQCFRQQVPVAGA